VHRDLAGVHQDPAGVQPRRELEDFYVEDDPWGYLSHPGDAARVARLLAALPPLDYERTLDLGCGNGFVTACLPGHELVGVDLSERAIEHATRRVPSTPGRRVSFVASSLFDLSAAEIGTFDLIVVTGLLYPQYIGESFSLVAEILRMLLRPDGIVASVHIDEWSAYELPLTRLFVSLDRYREFFHRLEIFQGPP
jgi:SAM-dependent methyltransferase